MTFTRMTLLILALTLSLAVFPASNAACAQTANRIVAFVNDDVITLHELHNKVKEMTGLDALSMRESNPRQYHNTRRMVLDRMIEDRIAEDKIQEMGITVGESEINAAIEGIMRENRWNREQLEEAVSRQGLTWKDYRKRVEKEIQKHRLVEYQVKSRIIIRDESIEAYYEKNRDRFQRQPGIELATIFLFNNNPGDSREAAELEKKAAELLERLRGGADFARMAMVYSDGPAAEEGGYLGRFDLDHLEPEIREVVENTPEGGASDLIVRRNGIQIVKVLDKGGTGDMPLEMARDMIHRILLNEELERRYDRWIGELKERAYTKILLD